MAKSESQTLWQWSNPNLPSGLARAPNPYPFRADSASLMSHKIYLLPGDGVGPEVVREGVKIMKAAESAFGLSLEFIDVPGGALYYKEHGKDWPDGSMERLRDDSDAILLGAVGWPGVSKPDGALAGGSLVLGVRFGLDLYANVRPTKLFPGVQHKVHDGFKQVWEPGRVDFVIVRENTEDLYSNTHGHLTRGGVTEVATDVRIITRKGSERVIRFAFELAKKRKGAISDGKRRVTCVDKSNVMRGCQLFRQVYDEVAGGYAGIERDYAYIDAFQQWLVRQPEFYDVAVTSNMMGDIATDLAAVLQGGMGMASSGNIGDRHAMFEPIHGSAPKHAGQDKVNPMATALAVQQLFDYLGAKQGGKGYHEAAAAVERAVAGACADGKVLTYDLGGSAKCSEVGSKLAAAVAAAK